MAVETRLVAAGDALERAHRLRFGALLIGSTLVHAAFWTGVQVATAAPAPVREPSPLPNLEVSLSAFPFAGLGEGEAGGGSDERVGANGGVTHKVPSNHPQAVAQLPTAHRASARTRSGSHADDPYEQLLGASPGPTPARETLPVASPGSERGPEVGTAGAAVAGAGGLGPAGSGGGGNGAGGGGGGNGAGGGGGPGGGGRPSGPASSGSPRVMTTQVLSFGAGMTRPVRLSGREPTYTREARTARVEGTMIVRCVITTSGTLEQCEVLKPLPHLRESVLEALATHRYTPVTFEGRPVSVRYVFNIKMTMP